MNKPKNIAAIILISMMAVGAFVFVCGCYANQYTNNTNVDVKQNPTEVAIKWAANHTVIDNGSVDITEHSGGFSIYGSANYVNHNYRMDYTSGGNPHHMDISIADYDGQWLVTYAMLDDHKDLLYNQDTHEMI